MSVDVFSMRELTRPHVVGFNPRTWLTKTFVKGRYTHETRTIQVDKVTEGRVMAVFSSPVSKGVALRRAGYTTTDIMPGYIKMTDAITPGELQNRLPGESLFAQPGNALSMLSRAERLVIESVGKNVKAIDRRVEYMTMTALTTGIITISDMNDKGEVVSERQIDFGYHADHTPTPTIDWDAEGATILADIANWCLLCAKNGGIAPNIMLVDTNAALALMNDATVQTFLDARHANVAEMQMAFDAANGVTDMGVLRVPNAGALRVCVYNEFYADPATGTLTQLFPANKVLLGNTNARVEIHCRPVEDLAIPQQFPEAAGMTQLAIPLLAKTWEEQNPSSRQILVQSGPVVIPFDINAFLCATVISD